MCVKKQICEQLELIFHNVMIRRLARIEEPHLLSKPEPTEREKWAKNMDMKMVEDFIVMALSKWQFLTYDWTKEQNEE